MSIDQETSIEVRKAAAAMEFGGAVKEFRLDQSSIFVSAIEKMEGMDHGPNHTEGDPKEHSELYVAELNSYVRNREGDFSAEEVRLLRLAGTLHDIGKAETLKYDVVSGKQNEVVGAAVEQIEQAQNLKLRLLAEVSGKSTEEITVLSGGKRADLLKQHEAVLQVRLIAVAKEYPALAANFRGHDKKSAEMSKNVIQESGLELSADDAELLDYLLSNHMNLLDLADLSETDLEDPKKMQGIGKIFENAFVEGEKGSRKINTRKIKLLLALTYADNASTHHRGDSDSDREAAFKRIVEVVEKLKIAIEPVLEKETQDKKVDDSLTEAFKDQGGLSAVLKGKGFQGKQIGEANAKVKEFVRNNLDQDQNGLNEKIRGFVQSL
ncbi:MAG: hypothetical protein UX09_C0011G0004 [Candidatus Uhrbacteria bacterium GW2011_GWE2_45_35]|uniref:HD domain-containing protein n=2 Tax=Candidatus Uhriibacteriota TaxID=1752732 RepID=A0A0G1JKF2_9BACT|nr:MAG: hypothetical protein UW63_C0007G0017 [Candidatus Uhrbacteria bacterium GW2011_GWF2_44_350]KKU08822.1 MAG: hypothetical protein UX09_C0011G0004 [Candidatus Uhrbacteria bacterium GW2011_GWE2_45_35]HBR80867.1 hypothetical protein [Candidatus Uhrbacteria bacterium]HCU32173.1 hypothetical protein [Candidatus Uhrbacteria bacterium]